MFAVVGKEYVMAPGNIRRYALYPVAQSVSSSSRQSDSCTDTRVPDWGARRSAVQLHMHPPDGTGYGDGMHIPSRRDTTTDVTEYDPGQRYTSVHDFGD
jgi:hypothetical protein